MLRDYCQPFMRRKVHEITATDARTRGFGRKERHEEIGGVGEPESLIFHAHNHLTVLTGPPDFDRALGFQ